MRKVREAIEKVIADSFPEYTFEYGRAQDINKYSSDVDLLCWLFPIRVANGVNTRGRLNRTFVVTIAFFGVDTVSSDNVESNFILENQFDKAEEFLVRLYFNAEENRFEPQESYSSENLFKFSAKSIFTGVQFTFQVSAHDQLNIC